MASGLDTKKLNIGILAHVDAGKTTLAEGLLYTCGKLRDVGRVDHGDAFLDTNAMEKERGITIFSKLARLQWKGMSLTLVDTPGHVDFAAEMERTLQILDGAILVVSGSDGVQGHTETLWKLLKRYEIPTFIFVNKMDMPGTDEENLICNLETKLGSEVVPFGKADTFERISLCDEAYLEEYLESETVCRESIEEGIVLRKVVPAFFGSALKLQGLEALLDAIGEFLPMPVYEEKFGARVYKIERDEQGNRLTHMKLTGGTLRARELVGNAESAADEEAVWEEKINQIRRYDGVKYEQLELAAAGDIVTVLGLTKTFAGQGLGAEAENEKPILEPVLSYALQLPADVLPQVAMEKLRLLEEEDPSLHIVWQEEVQEIHILVMGQVQTEILKRQIYDRFGMEVVFGQGKIVYKETIASPTYGIGHFEPLRHYAEVHLLLEPAERGSGISFYSLCSEDVLDKNWQRLIKTHVEEAIHPGVLTRSELTDVRVILMNGRAHPKHTVGGDFRQATYRAIRNALRLGDNVLLEPQYAFFIEVPTEYIGRVMTDLDRMKASVSAPVSEGEFTSISGTVAVSEFADYTKEVAAYTAGRGTVNASLSGFAPCNHAQEVVDARGYDPDADLKRPTASVFCAHGSGFVVPYDQVAKYAHLEKRVLRTADDEMARTEEVDAQNAIVWENAPSARKEQAPISLEEIDAILGQTFRKGRTDDRQRRRYHVTRNADKTRVSGKSDRGGQNAYVNRIKPPCMLVDGYNMIFAWEELRILAEANIDSARDRLMDICCDYQGSFGGELILVYDAYKVKGNPGSVMDYRNIHVVFTKEAETADAYIERTTAQKAADFTITVATSDRLEQMIVWGNGALRMSAREFEQEITRIRQKQREEFLEKTERLGNRPFAEISNYGIISSIEENPSNTDE